MSKFWIQFAERWSRNQAEREKKDKTEKEERKAVRKALRSQIKMMDGLIKEITKNEPRDEGAPWSPEHRWWIFRVLDCLALLKEQTVWLLKREEKGDEP